MGLGFEKKDISKIEIKNNICINVYCYQNKLVCPIYISDQKFENFLDLLLVIDENNYITCISQILIDLCFTKQRIGTKNTFTRVVCSVLVVKMC